MVIAEKNNAILIVSMLYENFILMEKDVGVAIPLDDLVKKIVKDAKGHKTKTNKQEIDEILEMLLRAGIVFYPKKNYVQRISSYER